MSQVDSPDPGVPAKATPNPRITRLIDYWRGLAPGPGLLPGRRHFDPMRVPDLLPNLWLIDVVRGTPNRYRYRLIGSALFDAGAPMRVGMFIDELGDTPSTRRRRRRRTTVWSAPGSPNGGAARRSSSTSSSSRSWSV